MQTSSRFPWGKGTIKWTYDATANDSDKSFTVPTGKIWKILYIRSELSTTATAGNRLLAVLITNGTNTVWIGNRTAAIAASKSGINEAVAGQPYSASTTQKLGLGAPDIQVSTPMPELLLPAGYVIRVYDTAAIDAAADDLTVSIEYIEYDA